MKVLAGALPLLLAACGGAAPVHTGYPAGEKEPWTSPGHLTLNDNNEASAEGTIAFPKRARAKWYVVELPVPGALSAKLTLDPQSTGADVGMEILDAGFNIVAEAQNDDDLAQPKKSRTVKEARAGKSYIHIFALNRSDVLDYKLRVKYEPKATTGRNTPPRPETTDGRSAFPWTIQNLPPLPAVPQADEGKPGHVVKPPQPTTTPEVKQPEVVDPSHDATVIAQITEFGKQGEGVRIIINKGSGSGIEEGWTGYVMVGKSQQSVQHGSFKVKKVKDDEAEGYVNLPLDVLQANRTVKLKAPK